jgi:MFS family permease
MGLAFSHAKVVLPAYLADLKASNVIIGVMGAIFVLGTSVPQAFSAYFTEHLPSKKQAVIFFHFLPPLAWLALFIYNFHIAGGPGSYGAAMTFFLPAVAFYACSLGLLLPIYFGFFSRVILEERRGRAFGTVFSVQCVFGAAAVCCAGFLLSSIVFPRNYAILFFLSFAAICIGNLFLLGVREPRDEAAKPRKSPGEYLRSFLTIFVRKRALRNYVFVRLLVALNMLLVFFYSKYARSVEPELEITYLVAFLLLGQSAGNLVFGRLGDRLGFRAVAAMGAALMLCAAAVSAALASLTGFYLIMAFAGFYLAADWISHLNIVLQLSSEGEHTKDLGFVGITTSLPLAAVSLLMGYLIDTFSFGAVALAVSSLAALGVVLLFAMKMPRRGRAPGHLAREPH